MDQNIGAYFEIPVENMDRAISFYEKLLDINLERGSIHGYEMAFFAKRSSGSGISGALAKGDVYKPTIDGILLYLHTTDIDALLERALGLGSDVLLKKTVADSCFVAEIMDCEGNRICFKQDF